MAELEFFIGHIQSPEKENVESKRFTLSPDLLTTHALVLGASGSGKTVICKAIVEEALYNDIPIIAIDPKGDISGLGISFGDFNNDDANIRVHAQIEAQDRGLPVEQVIEELLDTYRAKLSSIFGEHDYKLRVKEYTSKVLPIIITPKNSAGLQISSIPDFEKPTDYKNIMMEAPDVVLSSLDLKISLLLRRCGIDTEGSTDNRVVYLSHLIRYLWESKNQSIVTLNQLIDGITTPPFDTIGAIKVERFITKKLREELIRRINALMVRAVPGIKLDFELLINTAKELNKTALIVIDLRKITEEEEKQIFVAEILEHVQRWIWRKGGTSRLRALLYFDELYGFMPAGSVKPASKTALLLLLKQARSGGLGCLLATQNPGDLDYRGLSNIATWFLGRLTSNQDIAKVENALKAVFEGAGGSSEDFKKLMLEMRGLKPAEFITYSPKLGIQKVKSRWLLSYHKGPLVDSEIKSLNKEIESKSDALMPKSIKIEKLENEKQITEEFVSQLEISTSGTQASINLQLLAVKPSIEKLEERFIKKKISLDLSVIQTLLEKRLNYDFEKDLWKIKINTVNPFYSPIQYASINLSLKLDIEITKSEKIPLLINQNIVRAYDLTKPNDINWESSSIEGLYPSALNPKDLRPTPDIEFKYYANLPKDLIKTLSGQLIWTLTNTPIIEAKKLFLKTLDEYEHSLFDQYTIGKNKLVINRLSEKISTCEGQLIDIEQKIGEQQYRLEILQADRMNRLKENHSVRSQDRSIEFTKTQLKKLTEKQSDLKNKYMKTLEEREQLIQSDKEVLKNITDKIAKLKSSGPSGDLFRPDKKDLTINEQIIYWLPRVSIYYILEKADGDYSDSLEANVNLFNGNGIIYCQNCNPNLNKRDYLEEMLSSEISPPMYVCNECLSTICTEHSHICNICQRIICSEHFNQCKSCKNGFCPDHTNICTNCQSFVCLDHQWKCSHCLKSFCYEEQSNICEICKKLSCNEGATFYKGCTFCNKRGHPEHFDSCGTCKKIYCTEHLVVCSTCKKLTCSDCRQEFRAGKDNVIIKCKNCL